MLFWLHVHVNLQARILEWVAASLLPEPPGKLFHGNREGLSAMYYSVFSEPGGVYMWKFNKHLLDKWISITSDKQMTPPYGRKQWGTKASLDESEKEEWKSWLKTQHSINKGYGIWSHHVMANRGKMVTARDFIFLGSKITADGDCSHEIKRCLLLGRKAMTNLVY